MALAGAGYAGGIGSFYCIYANEPAVVGVPVIAPLAAFRAKPGGGEPGFTRRTSNRYKARSRRWPSGLDV